MEGPAVDQALERGRALNLYFDDFYFNQVLSNHAAVKISSTTETLAKWAESTQSVSREKVNLSYLLTEKLCLVTELFEVRENILQEIQLRENHRGNYSTPLVKRVHSSQNKVTEKNLRMAIDKVVPHAFLLQSKEVKFTNGNVFSPLVEDITLVFAKDTGAHEIKIRGLRSFTNENVANYTDEIIDKIIAYVRESKDQLFSSVLKQVYNLRLGDLRTNRTKCSDVNLLRTTSAKNDTLYMPARSDPVFGINMREALLLTRAHTAPANLDRGFFAKSTRNDKNTTKPTVTR